jgi:UDPglucose--hexose-1-phosphate uridylyltransferase
MLEPPTPEELEECPFCAGREDRTPPETLRLPAHGPWTVRVFPNLYPALERQEVVAHSPLHKRSLAELSGDEVDLIAEAWRRRAHDVGRGYVHAFVNEGRDAGASLPHSHSQLAWLDGMPPAVAAEGEVDPGEIVLERDGLVAGCPPASRVPYEVVVAPARAEADPFAGDLLAPALRLVVEVVRRLHRLEGGPVPLNVWLHHGRSWHLELVPRGGILAGLELGAGVYVNAVPPEEAARSLRNA